MLGCKDLYNSFFDGFVFGCTDVVAFTKSVTVMRLCLTAEFICCKEILQLPHTNERFDSDTFPFTDKQPTWVEDPVNLDNQVIHRDKFMGGGEGGLTQKFELKINLHQRLTGLTGSLTTK